MTDSSQKSSSSRRLSSSSASSGQISRHRSQHGNNSGNSVPNVPDIPAWLTQPPVRNATSSSQQSQQATSSRIGSSPHKKSHSLTKTSRDGNKDISKMLDLLDPTTTTSSSSQPQTRRTSQKQKEESTNSNELSSSSSKQSKKAKIKAATEEALKQFNDLQMVEHKLASQTNEVMARVKHLFQPNMSDEEAFGTLTGDDLLNKNGSGSGYVLKLFKYIQQIIKKKKIIKRRKKKFSSLFFKKIYINKIIFCSKK